MKKYFLFLWIVFTFITLSGCVNGRIWGDRFLQGWLSENTWKNTVSETTVNASRVDGFDSGEIIRIGLVSGIPLMVVLVAMTVRYMYTVKMAVAVLVACIEHGSNTDDIKRISSIVSGADPAYRKIVKKELTKIRSKK